MTGQVCETIRRWLGWCPHVNTQIRHEKVLSYCPGAIPPGSGSYKERVFHWLGLFRNQTILQTIGTICVGVYLFAGLGGLIHPNLFLIGILTGLPFSVLYGFWYWRIFNEVLFEGPVVLRHRFSIGASILAVVSAVVIIYAQIYFLTGLTPWFDATITNAFIGGFVAVSFIGMLFSVWRWESDTHRHLHYDGLILELGEEGNHALY